MKANELMIGDWVRIKLHQRNTQVTNIDSDYLCTKAEFPLFENEIESIPLTAEILEKNGFGDSFAANEKIFGCEDFGIWIDFKEQGYWACIKNKVSDFYFEGNKRYVHELQHALKLCGIDKEIVL